MSTARKSWRDIIKIHPAADLFPLMSADELKTLSVDIKKNGLRVPITVWKEQKNFLPVLLDGRNRLDAMEAAGMAVKVEHGGTEFDPQVRLWQSGWPIEAVEVRGDHDNGDPYAYVISANINRRHLTTAQRIELVEKVIKANPNMSGRRAAKLAGVSPTTATKSREKLERRGDVSTVDTSIDTKGRKQPVKKKRRTADDFIREVREGKETKATNKSAIQPEKSTSSDCAYSGGPEVPATSEKLTSELPTGLVAEEKPVKNESLTTAWDRATLEERGVFVEARLTEITDALKHQAENSSFWKAAENNNDDGLDIPDYLRRVPAESAR